MSLKLNLKKSKNTLKPYPSGQDFQHLLEVKLPKHFIESNPLFTAQQMHKDNGLYLALVSIVSSMHTLAFIHHNKNLFTSCKKFIQSYWILDLSNDEFGTYYENGARCQCFVWLKAHLDKVTTAYFKE